MDAFYITIGIWVGAILTICTYSWLYKENILSRFTEHTLIAATAAIYGTVGFRSVISLGVNPVLQGDLSRLIPIILGLALYLRFNKKTFFISRWPLAILIAAGIGIQVRSFAESRVIAQIKATMINLNGPSAYTNLSNIIIFLMVLFTIAFFTYTFENKSWTVPSKIGRYCVMIYLGAMYGNTVAARINILIGRLMFILWDWLQLA